MIESCTAGWIDFIYPRDSDHAKDEWYQRTRRIMKRAMEVSRKGCSYFGMMEEVLPDVHRELRTRGYGFRACGKTGVDLVDGSNNRMNIWMSMGRMEVQDDGLARMQVLQRDKELLFLFTEVYLEMCKDHRYPE